MGQSSQSRLASQWEKQASVAGNNAYNVIYVFMSPDNISYMIVRSCQDELPGVAKNGTMRTGCVAGLQKTLVRGIKRTMRSGDEIYYNNFKRKKKIKKNSSLVFRLYLDDLFRVFFFFHFIFSNTKNIVRVFFFFLSRAHCSELKVLKSYK